MPLRDEGFHPDAKAAFDKLIALGDHEVNNALYAMFLLADDALGSEGEHALARAAGTAGVRPLRSGGSTIYLITLTRGTRGVVAAFGVRGLGLRILAVEFFASTILEYKNRTAYDAAARQAAARA
jgi:hypothetical protein